MLSSDSKMLSEDLKQKSKKIPFLRDRLNKEEKSTSKLKRWKGNKLLSSKTG